VEHFNCDICEQDQNSPHNPEDKTVICNTCLRTHRDAINGLDLIGVRDEDLHTTIQNGNRISFSMEDNVAKLRAFIDTLKVKADPLEQLTLTGIDLAVPKEEAKVAVSEDLDYR
jgi:hypothetical protein